MLVHRRSLLPQLLPLTHTSCTHITGLLHELLGPPASNHCHGRPRPNCCVACVLPLALMLPAASPLVGWLRCGPGCTTCWWLVVAAPVGRCTTCSAVPHRLVPRVPLPAARTRTFEQGTAAVRSKPSSAACETCPACPTARSARPCDTKKDAAGRDLRSYVQEGEGRRRRSTHRGHMRLSRVCARIPQPRRWPARRHCVRQPQARGGAAAAHLSHSFSRWGHSGGRIPSCCLQLCRHSPRLLCGPHPPPHPLRPHPLGPQPHAS